MKLMKSISALALVTLTLPAHADNIRDALRECGQTQNSLQRLVCYDRVVNELEKYSGLDDLMSVPAPLPPGGGTAAGKFPRPEPRGQQPDTAAPAPSDNFGIEHKNIEINEDMITSTVASVKEDPYGKSIVTLSNGHVWKQVDSTRLKLDDGEEVYVERGMLGSFFLGKSTQNRRMRVKRVQ
ncbi:hypothetical protein LJ739_13195 [Aestuariibacter halophilus]|uniref:Type IV pilus biogenesis protein PilP n=1 Tax=Fluctibacter halophilus TaxID=226011 RepID=A0ABS8G9M0_9ALTE|nr:hypothetical protein [Aestuariibacter halophilus]MCC2617203.1 hypothetical protein [Aestuariibacter halophilus]